MNQIQDLLGAGHGVDGLLRSVIQHHRDAAAYVYAGSAPSLMRELFDDRERPPFGLAGRRSAPGVVDPAGNDVTGGPDELRPGAEDGAPEVAATGPVVGWVCGYGSLAALTAPLRAADGVHVPAWGTLEHHGRDWGVAMDNRDPVSDPKHYVLVDDGRRFCGHVAFLDVVPAEDAVLGALAIPVDAARLEALDAREVNYDRHEVTDHFAVLDGDDLRGPVWTYRGTPDGRARAARAATDGTLVVSAGYVRRVTAAFAAQPAALPGFGASTVPCAWPQRELAVVSRPELLGY